MRNLLTIGVFLIGILVGSVLPVTYPQSGTYTDTGGMLLFQDGQTSGTITDLGGGMRLYQDSQGRSGMLQDFGGTGIYNITPPTHNPC